MPASLFDNVSNAADSQELIQTDTLDDLQEDKLLAVTKKAKQLADEISWVRTQRKPHYVKDLFALKNHKSVDVRRRAISAIGDLAGQDVLDELRTWQELESDRTAWVALEGVIDKIQRKIDGEEDFGDKVLTVSEALSVVKQLIGNKEYIIEGELSEVRTVRNLYFFGLKDKVDVRINCMLVSYSIGNIGFALNEGLQVRVRGSFKMSKDSRIYFDIKKISLTGEGELLRNLTLLDQKLQMEGLYDPSRKRTPVILPQRILLLASPNSAAIKDFTKVLGERRRGINIYFLPIKTQGAGSEFDLLQSLKQAHDIIKEYDIQTVIITRGGGSQDDLQLFNSELVVRAVHRLPVPTIVAIGHERDVTLAEKVADVRASTPSNAAELVSRSTLESMAEINGTLYNITSQFRSRKQEYVSVTNLLFHKIVRSTTLLIQEARTIVIRSEKSFFTLIYRAGEEARNSYRAIISLSTSLHNEYSRKVIDVKPLLFRTSDHIASYYNQANQLVISAIKNGTSLFEFQKIEYQSLIKMLNLMDPRVNLEKGYAIIKQENSVIDRVKHVNKTKPLEIMLFDGSITAKVDKMEEN